MSQPLFISSVDGNSQKLDGGSMFGNAPKEVWKTWHPPDEKGRIDLATRAMLVEIGETKILCELGIGAFFDPKMADRFGIQNSDTHQLLNNLKTLGLSHQDIDYVILSHLHFDHAGGIFPTYQDMQQGNQDLLFPNATYLVGIENFERSKKPHFRDRASFIPGLAEKLEETGRLTLIEGETAPEAFKGKLSFRYSHGHTPGHMHALFHGNKETIFFAGDLIPGAAWVHLPITMGYDRFAEKVIDEKQSLYEKATKENWRIFFTHDPTITSAKIVQQGKKFLAEDPTNALVRREF